MISTGSVAKGTDLFNFQGIRRRIFIAPDYAPDDSRLKSLPVDEVPLVENFDGIAEQFDALVFPSVDQTRWIADREHERAEIDRLGDLIHFYEHKPHLTDFEKQMYKRIIRRDRSMQTDEEPESKKSRKGPLAIPKIRLPPPLAMERVEEFLSNNRWRLIDLFRTVDLDKSWGVAKDDFMRFIKKEQLEVTEGQADELLWCFCRDANVPMSYRKFARGRSSFKKSIRTKNSTDPMPNRDPPPTPSSASSSNYLKLPKIDTSDHYPVRDIDSPHSRSTMSSTNKPK